MKRGESGMTMVETLVAMSILIVGLVGAFGAFDGVRRLGTIAEKKQEASRYAQRELEHMRSLGFAYLYLSSTPANSNDSRGIVASGNYTPPNGGTASPLRIGSGLLIFLAPEADRHHAGAANSPDHKPPV